MGNFGILPLNCPPSQAKATTNEIMYRLVENNPPESSDFVSIRRQNPQKEYDDSITECKACGLSLFDDEQGAINMKKKIPRLRKLKIARGQLGVDSGAIQHTPSQNSHCHYTWWIHIDQNPCDYFQVI
jgi:hypothetical protein